MKLKCAEIKSDQVVAINKSNKPDQTQTNLMNGKDAGPEPKEKKRIFNFSSIAEAIFIVIISFSLFIAALAVL